uniref:MOSC domain-containing protein n=1 Tax=Globodera pallida TaxID=36090 RepID=A0A183C022_GLOPA
MVAGTVVTVCALGTVAVVLLLIVQRKRHRRCDGDGTAFVRAGQVEQLYIYPIKSCKGNKRDRHFLVVDSMRHNQMLTGRIYPRMLLIRAHVEHDVLCVQFPDRNPVQVRLKEVQQHNHVRRARLFSDLQTDGLDCGDEVAKALDEFLLPKEGDARDSRKLRLIYRWWLNNAVPEVKDKIAYADLAGYMAFSSASEIRVDARNFRPNLVISGLPPFDEDRWLYVRAGDAEFACYKPCTRCVMTTIDPDSGCRNAKMEPLKELRKYRLAPGKLYEIFKESPVFGVNMAIIKPGRVRIGDPVYRLAPGKLYEIFKESPVFGVNMAIIKPGRVRIGDPVWIRYKPRPF